MSTITGIFDGAKDKIRQGKTSIRQSISGLGSYELSFGHGVFNNEESTYGKKWSSDFDLPGSNVSNKDYPVNGTAGQMNHTEANISWDISQAQTGLGLPEDGSSAAVGLTETEPNRADGGWLNHNPFD